MCRSIHVETCRPERHKAFPFKHYLTLWVLFTKEGLRTHKLKKMHAFIVLQRAYTFYSSFSRKTHHGSDTCTGIGWGNGKWTQHRKKKKKAHVKNKLLLSLKYRRVLSLAAHTRVTVLMWEMLRSPVHCSLMTEPRFSCYTRRLFFFHNLCPPRWEMAL